MATGPTSRSRRSIGAFQVSSLAVGVSGPLEGDSSCSLAGARGELGDSFKALTRGGGALGQPGCTWGARSGASHPTLGVHQRVRLAWSGSSLGP